MNSIKPISKSHNDIIRHSTSVGEHENKLIKKLEKKLRKKPNVISKGFKEDGLDYLLEVCDSIETNDLDDLREPKNKKQKVEKIAVKETKKQSNKNSNAVYEDIYGRIRSKNGSILVNDKTSESKNNKIEINNEIPINTKLQRTLTGLLNRLAENNMCSISKQIEELYMKNSRQEMNKTLLEIINKNLIKDIHSPERLIIEHVVLIAILSANIGYEIGAQFLESFVRKFSDLQKSNPLIEDKQLDNIVQILAQMYNFKICHNTLLYDILQELSKSFLEKDIECILIILRAVGFTLRKDDPIALKNLILELQFKARSNTNEDTDPRVKFMLEVVLAIKNNNVSKIPNYDTSYSEHLKKVFKTYVRKGHSLTPLSIKLNEILNVDKKGRWWIVGSSWVGNEDKLKKNVSVRTENSNNKIDCPVKFNENLLELARRQHMNTDVRRNIFCILMSAEDYMDAFEKLLQLNLKNTQEREIINVIIHCCLQEKTFNAYYAVLAERFCDYHKNYQITIRYSVWDKIKILKECSNNQINNLACFISHLLINKSVSITVLKTIEFNELETATLNFIRKILVNVLLHDNESDCLQVFQKVSSHSSTTDSSADNLKIFRKSLRLFIHHFILTNFDTNQIHLNEDQKVLFQNRVEILDKFL